MRLREFIERNLILETYKNLFSTSEKEKWAEQVWEVLQTSYADIGGIKGSGFNSIQDMITNIPFWKIFVRDGQVLCVIMYKDKNGRKLVAIGTSGTREGKDILAKTLIDGVKFEREFGEVSGAALKFLTRRLAKAGMNLDDFLIPADEVEQILGKKVHIVSKFEYKRNIGGSDEVKVMYGKPENHIKLPD